MTNDLLDTGPQLLLNWRQPEDSRRHWIAGAGALAFHVLFVALAVLLPQFDGASRPREQPEPIPKHVTLIAPNFRLTQKDPTKAKPVEQVHLEDLLPKPALRERVPTPEIAPKKAFQAPPRSPSPPGPNPALPPPPEPPKFDASVKPPQEMPPALNPVPPPQIQPQEKPKLAFESPGQGGSSTQQAAAPMKIPMPRTTIDDAVRSVARSGGGGSGGVAVGDMDQLPSPRENLNRPASPGRLQSQVQLMSDPMGVDFKPYLIRLLSTVKRNWFAVYPESARLGLRGTVALRFWVDRDGKVPHLELAMPSGATALDRAAVASISASVPLPPLPAEYKGQQVVLQFSFRYN